MTLGLVLFLLAADPGSAPTHTARLLTPAKTSRNALMVSTQVLALAAGGAASIVAGSFWLEENFRAYGRPDPRVFAASIAIAMAVNMALAWLLLPDLARLTNDAGGAVDVSAIRHQTWRVTRWVALAGLIFVGILTAGAVLEQGSFGRGQAVMAVGAGGAAASVLAFDLAALLTVKSAAATTRGAAR